MSISNTIEYSEYFENVQKKLSDNYPGTTQNYKCEFCEKVFKYDSGYYRHKKYRCKEKISEISQIKIENILLKNKIGDIEKDKEIAVLKKALEIKTSENEFNRKLTIGAGQTVNKSLSALGFVMQNYQNAHPLRTIPHEEFKRLVYEENVGKKVHKNKKISDLQAGQIITSFFKQNNLINLLGNVIVNFYKTNKKELQSLWVSDISRKSFVVNNRIDGVNQWATDKKGVKVSEIIVDPVLKYVDKLMVSYMKNVHDMLGKCNYSDVKYIEELKYSTELRTELCTNKICDELIKTISPNFYLTKSELSI